MGSKRERRADRALVAAYHEARLGELIQHVTEAVDRFRTGEQDAFAVDEVLHQYQRAARELWKFCWRAGAGAGVERTAREMAAEGESIDWWERFGAALAWAAAVVSGNGHSRTCRRDQCSLLGFTQSRCGHYITSRGRSRCSPRLGNRPASEATVQTGPFARRFQRWKVNGGDIPREVRVRTMDQDPRMPAVTRKERLARAGRVLKPKVWKSIAFGLTEPQNDWHWDFIAKRNTAAYLFDPIPWLTEGAAQMLEGHLMPDSRVFEWGAGSSTLWFMRRVADVLSYETDREWVDAIRPMINDRCDLRQIDSTSADYSRPDLSSFDVVLIDAFRRSDCSEWVAQHGPAGVLAVLDDSERDGHLRGAEALSQRAERQWHFPGLTAMMTPNLTSLYLLGAAPDASPCAI